MGRRLILIIGIALAVGSGAGRARAEAEPPPREAPPTVPAEGLSPNPQELPPLKAEGLPPLAPGMAEPPALPAPPELPAPEGPTPPAPTPPAPTRDPAVQPSQIPVKATSSGTKGAAAEPETGPLPQATEVPGGPASASAGDPPNDTDRFVLPPERLQLGKQTVGLTVEVNGPPTLNLNQVAVLRVVVKNVGNTDAMGVVVRDELPQGLTLVSSQPVEQRAESTLFWNLNTVPAGSERVILLRVKPTVIGAFDHAATVTMRSGSKSRTIVREPKLKVEQSATSGKVLKGQAVQFKITLSNPGDGPARKVTIRAKLSPGLRHESGELNDQNLFEQTLDQLRPGESVVLDPLVADTILGGEQSCRVDVQSPDVSPGGADAESTQTVTVVEPKLEMTVGGPDKRYTDTTATYIVTLKNPGTATAKNIHVLATLPAGGRLAAVPPGARYNSATRRIQWDLAQLEFGDKEKLALPFQVSMGGPGLYQVAVEAKADGVALAKDTFSTDVIGMADVEVDVTEKRRSVDVGDTTTYQIRIKNFGSKEATHLLLSAKLSENIEPIETDNGTDEREQAKFNVPEQKLVFPTIAQLGPGKEIVMGIKVKANKPGLATCRVFLVHDDLESALDDVAATKVTATKR